MPCLSKQCRSRSVGFWRSQLIWICTVCHYVNYINNLDQVIWLAENYKWAWHLNLFSMTRVKSRKTAIVHFSLRTHIISAIYWQNHWMLLRLHWRRAKVLDQTALIKKYTRHVCIYGLYKQRQWKKLLNIFQICVFLYKNKKKISRVSFSYQKHNTIYASYEKRCSGLSYM